MNFSGDILMCVVPGRMAGVGPIAAYREHQIKMIRLLPDCLTLIAHSQISDALKREIETIEARISGCHPGYDEFPNANVYS